MKQSNDFVWVLKHQTNKLTKTWEKDGTISNYDDPKMFIGDEQPVNSIHDLSKILSKLERMPNACIIRGKYKGFDHSKQVEPDDTKQGRVLRRKSVHDDVPHHWFLVDIDNYEPVEADAMLDPVGAIDEFIRTKLPNCFHGTSYHWQLSSSAGHPSKNPAKLKAHAWFWLKTPYTSVQMRMWANANDYAGDKALFDTIQVHYTAAPVFEDGVHNPVTVRSGFVDGDFGEMVDLTISEEILRTAGDGSAPASRMQKLQAVHASDPIAALLNEKSMVKSKRPDGGLNITCPRHEHHTGESGESSTIYYAAYTGGYRRGTFVCLHEHCRGVAQSQFLDALGYDDLSNVFQAITDHAAFESYGDISNGRRFAEKFRGIFLFSHATSTWYLWDGQRWKPCDTGEAIAAAKAIADECISETLTRLKDEGTESAKRSHTQALAVHRSIQKLEAMLKAASSEPGMSIAHPGLFDADPWKLNVRNGVLDLKTGELLPARPEMRGSRLAGVAYDRLAECPMWIDFVHAIMHSDSEMVGFLQRVCGYALTGFVDEEKLFFFYGTGANGKSVFANILLAAFDEYGVTVRAALLARDPKGSGSDAEREKARLPGARIALMNETGQADIWDDQRTKELVSRENISARQLYAESFEFTPTHKLIIRGNHQPGAMDGSDGFWRRIVLIGFTRQFGEAERIPDLDRQIIERELPGVLAWMVDGCLEWRKNGLQVPAKVTAAVNAYRKDTDLMGEWIASECTRTPEAEGVSSELFSDYVDFLKDANVKAPSRNVFGRQLVQRGFRKRESNGKVFYSGLAVRNPFDSEGA